MPRLSTFARFEAPESERILKVLTLDEFLRSRYPPEDCALCWDGSASLERSRALRDLTWGAVYAPASPPGSIAGNTPVIAGVRDGDVINPGDVIAIGSAGGRISVLYRRGANANSLFVTARCNSYCLMCSQPPKERDERGQLERLHRVIDLVDENAPSLGITGGEPTLLGEELVQLARHCAERLPETHLHILSNGRLLRERDYTERLAAVRHPDLMWGIPLYSDAAELHDYVVQAKGAFGETLAGLHNLWQTGAKIEIRVVLHRQTVDRLPALSEFIRRNLPFVGHVALMGLEPIGFARTNRKLLWIEPADFVKALEQAVGLLAAWRIPVSIYNLPLCVLPRRLWPFTRKSISDWKNKYQPECGDCAVRSDCAGFFSWATGEWMVGPIRPVANLDSERMP